MSDGKPAPAAVTVENEEPISVEVVGSASVGISEREQVARGVALESDRAALAGEGVAKARATESGLVSQGQRDISRIWERTQQVIALAVIGITLAVGAWKAVTDLDDASAFTLLASLANLVIGFYFGRTNHARVGGVGGDTAGTR